MHALLGASLIWGLFPNKKASKNYLKIAFLAETWGESKDGHCISWGYFISVKIFNVCKQEIGSDSKDCRQWEVHYGQSSYI